MRKQVELLKHHAYFRANDFNILKVMSQFSPVDNDSALLMLFESVDAANQGGFARPRRPADHDPLTTAHFEVDVF